MRPHPHFLWSDFFKSLKIQKTSLIEALRENVLFSTLNSRELVYLSRIVYERVYQPDEVIFQQNDRSFGMYIVAKGRVAITTQSSDSETYVTTLSKNSFFGEVSLIDPDMTRTASARAVDKSVLIGFFKPDLLDILERKPAMGVKILYQLSQVLGRRLMETTEKITLLTQARGYGQVHGESF